MVLMLLLTALPLLTPATRAATVNITVTNDSLTLDYRLEVRTNLTRTMPLVRVLVNASNSTADLAAITGPIEKAMQKRIPEARLDTSGFKFSAKTEVLNATTKMWMIQENITGNVLGARSSPGQLVNYKLDFLSMNISDSIRLANVEFNQIGRTYLLQPLQSQSTGPTPPDVYFLSSAQYSTSFVPSIVTGKFDLLDFTWLPEVSQWSNTPEALGPSSTWTYDPSTMGRVGAPYNLTLGTHPVENTYLNFTIARYAPTVHLTAPPRARADGSTVSFDLPSAAEVAMPLIVAASLGVGLVSYFAERRALGSASTRARKKR